MLKYKDIIEKAKKIFSLEKNDDGSESFIKSVLYAFLLAMFVRTFIYEPFHIPSGSMKPGLLEGDFILVSKFLYGYGRYTIPFGVPLISERIFDFKKPERGDVIVFRLPSNPKINYIKRLIGIPGDKVVVKNNILYINDEEIKREYMDEYLDDRNSIMSLQYLEHISDKKIKILQNKFKRIDNKYDGDGEFIVPDGYYFFMGDNRDNSLDSRFAETGFVPYKNIVGRASIIFFSKNDSLFKFWKWNKSIRFKRILKIIR
jgi:signal peptidase I